MDNIAQSCELLDVVVRINVDKHNADTVVELLAELNGRNLLKHLSVHFAPVTSSQAACASIRNRCFTDEQFARTLVHLYRKLFASGIYVIDYPQVFSGGHCGAVSENYYVVSPSGLLFGCWEELASDPAASIGSISDDHRDRRQEANRQRYRAWDPFGLSECRDCDILPVCMGGCPLHGLRSNRNDKGVCSPFKHNLRGMLVLRHLYDTLKEVRA
jgi:uncharacterized protein